MGALIDYWCFRRCLCAPLVILLLADAHIIALLAAAAYKGLHGRDGLCGMPYRTWAVLVVLLLFGAFLFAFSSIDLQVPLFKNETEFSDGWMALYNSVLKIATFGYRDAKPVSAGGYWYVLLELASGVLLLGLAIPVLVGRFATFGECAKAVSVERKVTIKPSSNSITVGYLEHEEITQTGTEFELTVSDTNVGLRPKP